MNSTTDTESSKTTAPTPQGAESIQTQSPTTPTQENKRDQQEQIPESLQLFNKLLSQLTPEQIESKPVSDFLKQQKESPFNGSGNGNNADGKVGKVTILDKIPSYDWEILSVTFESIFNEYTNEMREVNQELEDVDNVCYLESLRQDLLSSVNVIKSTMYKFDESPNNEKGGNGDGESNKNAASSGATSTTVTGTTTSGAFEKA
ncbi:unnamed protein product [Ambrosiozyma monospora]|uniref:Unnamed protein product n=1 Tax=Ambrosiozyma monospora TaxID=43982 RepID=A0ACB5T2T1_AMBMO|nr:unnamed protein product [Ambrosiozyma monospora]